jgi:hypothetical protein
MLDYLKLVITRISDPARLLRIYSIGGFTTLQLGLNLSFNSASTWPSTRQARTSQLRNLVKLRLKVEAFEVKLASQAPEPHSTPELQPPSTPCLDFYFRPFFLAKYKQVVRKFN